MPDSLRCQGGEERGRPDLETHSCLGLEALFSVCWHPLRGLMSQGPELLSGTRDLAARVPSDFGRPDLTPPASGVEGPESV